MRFIPFPYILTLPISPAAPGPCQARLPNGRQCRRPASRASGYYKCRVHDYDRGRDLGAGQSLRPTDRAVEQVLA